MRSIIRFLSSLRLAIVLIILLAVASILGTLIPQGRSLEEYAARYGAAAGLMIKLQLTGLYHSLWYLALLVLLGLNIVGLHADPPGRQAPPGLPSAARDGSQGPGRPQDQGPDQAERGRRPKSGPPWRRPFAEPATGSARRPRQAASPSWPASASPASSARTSSTSGCSSSWPAARHGRRRHTGPSSRCGEGQTLDVPGADFALRLDKFETVYYPDGSVKAWKSAVNGHRGRPRRARRRHRRQPSLHLPRLFLLPDELRLRLGRPHPDPGRQEEGRCRAGPDDEAPAGPAAAARRCRRDRRSP